MQVIHSHWPRRFGAAAICVWPFGVLMDPGVEGRARRWVMRHEAVHWKQQQRWGLAVPVVGIFVWYLCYLLLLPVGWNPWRYRWEFEAMTEGQGIPENEVRTRLGMRPYYLWWQV